VLVLLLLIMLPMAGPPLLRAARCEGMIGMMGDQGPSARWCSLRLSRGDSTRRAALCFL